MRLMTVPRGGSLSSLGASFSLSAFLSPRLEGDGRVNTFWKEGREPEKSWTAQFLGFSFSWFPVIEPHVRFISSVNGLVYWILAPPPQRQLLKLHFLPLWTSKLCPSCTGAATLGTITHTHASLLDKTRKHWCKLVFPQRVFLLISVEGSDIFD